MVATPNKCAASALMSLQSHSKVFWEPWKRTNVRKAQVVDSNRKFFLQADAARHAKLIDMIAENLQQSGPLFLNELSVHFAIPQKTCADVCGRLVWADLLSSPVLNVLRRSDL